MKKLLALGLAVGLSGMASAVTMQWATATAVKFNDGNLKSDSSVTGYLIALDAFADSYALSPSFSASDIGTQVDELVGTSAMSKISKRWTINTDTYANGSTFSVLLKYTGADDGKVYWNLTSALVTLTGYALDPPTNAGNTSSAFNYATSETKGTLTAGGGWTTVPEPGTAALALLGVGMLLKRRKA